MLIEVDRREDQRVRVAAMCLLLATLAASCDVATDGDPESASSAISPTDVTSGSDASGVPGETAGTGSADGEGDSSTSEVAAVVWGHKPDDRRPPTPDRPRMIEGAARWRGVEVPPTLRVEFQPERTREQLATRVCGWLAERAPSTVFLDLYWPVELPCADELDFEVIDISGFIPTSPAASYPGRPTTGDILTTLAGDLEGDQIGVLVFDDAPRLSQAIDERLSAPSGTVRVHRIGFDERGQRVREALDTWGDQLTDLIVLIPPSLVAGWLADQRARYRVHVVSAPDGGPALAWELASSDEVTAPDGRTLTSHYRPVMSGAGWLPNLDVSDPGSEDRQPVSPEAAGCLDAMADAGAEPLRHPSSYDLALLYCEAFLSYVGAPDRHASVITPDRSAGEPPAPRPFTSDSACDCLRWDSTGDA